MTYLAQLVQWDPMISWGVLIGAVLAITKIILLLGKMAQNFEVLQATVGEMKPKVERIEIIAERLASSNERLDRVENRLDRIESRRT